MTGDIKGITIEFGGDATPLQKAIRTVDSELKKTANELKNVNKALKFNPTSVDLWKQKQQLLKDRISETTEKLDALKAAQKQMDAAKVDKNSEEYRKLQREIIETSSQLKHFKAEQRSIGSAHLTALSEQFKKIGSSLETAGQKMRGLSTAAAAVSASIGALTTKSAKWADDIITGSKVYSMSTKELQKYNAAAQLVDVSADAIAKTHRKLERNMLNAQLGSKKQALAFEELGIAYENADGSLRDGDAVWQDTIEALSKMENETERDAYAMALLGRAATDLNPLIEDGAEGYKLLTDTMEKYDLEFVDDDMLQKANDFNDLLDTIKAIGLVAFQQLGTQLSAYLAPALEKVVDWVGRAAQWVTNLDPKLLAIIGGIAGVVAAIAPVLIVIGKISTGVGALIKVIGLLAGPVGIVIAVIAALVAVGVVLYKNWDTIKEKAAELKDNVVNAFNEFKAKVTAIWTAIKTATTNAWNAIKTAIMTPIQTAKATVQTTLDTLKTAVDSKLTEIKTKFENAFKKIKGFIEDPISTAKSTISGILKDIKGFFPISIGNIFSGIKLPHFSLDWGEVTAFGKTVKYPKGFDVSWYAKGGIFNSPTILAGVGEAGPEAVVPLDKFWQKMDQMSAGTNIVININGSSKDPREIAEEVKRVLIRETNQRRLGWQ